SRCFPDLLTLLDMPDLLLYFQKIMAERGLTYKVGFTGRLQLNTLPFEAPLSEKSWLYEIGFRVDRTGTIIELKCGLMDEGPKAL
ncbi:MAG: hypothetical protein ABSH41_30065, partial [Syntrophobacteraceae bacterium]